MPSWPCDGDAPGRVAICIAGQPRMPSELIRKVMLNVIQPIQASWKHVFVAVPAGSDSLQQRVWQPQNITTVEPLKHAVISVTNGGTVHTHDMAHTLRACAEMIEASEASHGWRYDWILRLRADQAYDFTWHPDSSSWRTRCGSGPTLHTTHCMTGRDFLPTNCVSAHEALCTNDQFGVLSRAAMNAYFVRLEESFSTRGAPRTSNGSAALDDPSGVGDLFARGWTRSPRGAESRGVLATDPPECKLGAILSQHRVYKRAFHRLLLDVACAHRARAHDPDARPNATCYRPETVAGRCLSAGSACAGSWPLLNQHGRVRSKRDRMGDPLGALAQLDEWPRYMHMHMYIYHLST